MGTPDDTQTLRAQLHEAERKFDAFRKRSREDAEKAYGRGRDEATGDLLDLADDFDRAIKALQDAAAPDTAVDGVRALRDRALRRFASLGYAPFAAPGDVFDPTFHEAVSVEPGAGPDGTILRVHRRGWEHGDIVVRPAMVTVLQGSRSPAPAQGDSDEALQRRRAMRRRHVPASGYVCPYGINGCDADCPGCAPAPVDYLPAADDEPDFAAAYAEPEER